MAFSLMSNLVSDIELIRLTKAICKEQNYDFNLVVRQALLTHITRAAKSGLLMTAVPRSLMGNVSSLSAPEKEK